MAFHKLEVNIPSTFFFPYGDAREVEGQYGLQHLYKVKVSQDQSDDDLLYTTPILHGKLVSAGVEAGAIMTILKKQDGKRTVWEIQKNSSAPVAPAPSAPAAKAGGGKPAAVAAPNFEDCATLLRQCIVTIMGICEVEHPNELGVAQAPWASTLYIQLSRQAGVLQDIATARWEEEHKDDEPEEEAAEEAEAVADDNDLLF